MRAPTSLPLAVLLGGILLIPAGHAQDRGASEPSVVMPTVDAGHSPVYEADSSAWSLDGQPEIKGSWLPDSLEDREARARWAARMDPGILLYMEPPAGTEMFTFSPPDTVDPEMIWPPNR